MKRNTEHKPKFMLCVKDNIKPIRVYLLFYELYAAVLGTTFIGIVVGNGFVRALTHSTEIEAINAQSLKRLDNSLGTLLRERVVNGVGALIVGIKEVFLKGIFAFLLFVLHYPPQYLSLNTGVFWAQYSSILGTILEYFPHKYWSVSAHSCAKSAKNGVENINIRLARIQERCKTLGFIVVVMGFLQQQKTN